MPRPPFVAASLLMMIAGGGLAQPSFDCAKAESEAEQAICADEGLSALDRRMAERFAAALDVVRSLDTGSAAAERALRTSQRGWISGRDACWTSDDLPACVREAYEIREAELVAIWLLEEPRAVRTYACESNPANVVTAYFFDTERPGLRLEYGDSIRAGWLVPAASGSKYATPFGGSFWTKGEEALFEWEEGRTMECTAAG